tara:strand:+ start:531 stop:755 length:225 start_codon:yes stop_codon:yes gene_type:complete
LNTLSLSEEENLVQLAIHTPDLKYMVDSLTHNFSSTQNPHTGSLSRYLSPHSCYVEEISRASKIILPPVNNIIN